MSGLHNSFVKLEVESSAEDGKPDSNNPFINHGALDLGYAKKSRRSELESIPDQIIHQQDKIQEYTRLYTAIRQQESQLQQSRNELSALHQELPARLLQAKREGESEQRQKTIADLTATSGSGRRAYDTIVQSHLEQLQQVRFEAYDKGYRDGKDEKGRNLRFEAPDEEAQKV
jgi:phosphoenolpyruvate-protein kinase (PTS system EI component)